MVVGVLWGQGGHMALGGRPEAGCDPPRHTSGLGLNILGVTVTEGQTDGKEEEAEPCPLLLTRPDPGSVPQGTVTLALMDTYTSHLPRVGTEYRVLR